MAMLLNCCSVRNKDHILYDLIVDNSIDILFLTETWLKQYETASIEAFLPESHNFFSFPREEKRGGGVGAAISKSFMFAKSINRKFCSFECMELNLTDETKKFSTYIIYRPPQSSTTSAFIEEFGSFVTEAEMASDKVLYVGDFNVWWGENSDSKAVEMRKILDAHHLKNLVNVPTHRSENILDLVTTKENSTLVSDVIIEAVETISNHKAISFKVGLHNNERIEKK